MDMIYIIYLKIGRAFFNRSLSSEKLSDILEVTCYPRDVNNLLNDTQLPNSSGHPPL